MTDTPKPKTPPGRPPTSEDLYRLGVPLGLCETCRHARVLSSKRSAFLRCGLAEVNPAFPRYPRLPVMGCDGFDPMVEDPTRGGGGAEMA